jgi:hypothetical protein
MRRSFLLVFALAALLALAIVGATLQAARGERPILLGGY